MPPSSLSLAALAPLVERFSQANILCVGDVMLDRFVYGTVDRISPEAPIPVMRQQRISTMLGGAGNVVRNLTSLGAGCCFISVVGDDAAGRQLTALVGEQSRLEPYLLTESGRITTEKTRYVSGHQQLLRCDVESSHPVSHASAEQLVQIAIQEMAHYQLLLLSDYGKGVLSDDVVKQLIASAITHKIPVLVDPKRRDFSVYKGATLVSPNLHELAIAAGCDHFDNDADILAAAHRLVIAHELSYLLVTRGKDGMMLIDAAGEALHIPAQTRDVFDVSGAGDTAIATLAAGLASGAPMADAARMANVAAGIVVGKPGTATIYRTDLKAALFTYEASRTQAKMLPHAIAADVVASWHEQGLSIGFTNGCFDVLHVGHLSSLQDARSHCDRLIVAINSDESVKRLKGPTRPINAEMDRAMLLAGLDPVDMVLIFREDTPLALIESLKPNVLMKGADYTIDKVVGAELVLAYGGRIELLPLREGYSSTGIIEKARA